MYEGSGSHFFRTTSGIQSDPDASNESRIVMVFLSILGVMEILCNFRLVLEGRAGKEIPESSRLEFLEKLLANYFALSDTEGNTSGLLNRGGIADVLLLKTLLAIRQKSQKINVYLCIIALLSFLTLTLVLLFSHQKNCLISRAVV